MTPPGSGHATPAVTLTTKPRGPAASTATPKARCGARKAAATCNTDLTAAAAVPFRPTRSPAPDRDLTAAQVTRLLGTTPGMLRSAVKRRRALPPTGRILGRPVWSLHALLEAYPSLRERIR